MPHFILEHSAGLADRAVVRNALRRLHDAAADSGVVSAIDLKMRAIPVDSWLVAGTAMPFAHLTVRLLEGRTPETKLALSKALLAVLTDCFPDIERLSVEMQDMDGFSYKKRPYATEAAHAAAVPDDSPAA